MDAAHAFALLYNLALLAVVIYATASGGPPERLGAGLNVAGSILSGLLLPAPNLRWSRLEATALSVDLCMALAFYLLAVRTTRYWPVWCFGIAVANVFIHVARALLPEIGWPIYSSAAVLWAYLALFALILGVRYEGGDPRWRRR